MTDVERAAGSAHPPADRRMTRPADSSLDTGSVLPSVTHAHDALVEANERRRVAHQAVVEYALRAVVAGEPHEAIMDACGFKEDGACLHGTRRQRFAQWMGQSVADLILEGES